MTFSDLASDCVDIDFLERLLFSIALTPGVYLIFLLYISNPWRNTNQNQCQISESTWNLVFLFVLLHGI